MRTLVHTILAIRLLVSVVLFAAFGAIVTHAQTLGEASLPTADNEIITVPAAPIQMAPQRMSDAFRMLIRCRNVYQGGLDDDAVARCIVVQTSRFASE